GLGKKESCAKGYAKGIFIYQMGMSSNNGVCHYHIHLNVMTFHTMFLGAVLVFYLAQRS
ncbi:Uncharacterized protein DAT39_013347, partial [Clarias magur]